MEEKLKDTEIRIRIKIETVEAISKIAEECGMTLSDLVQDILNNYVEEETS